MLPYYCQPALILPMQELPRTARGKIDKRLLLEHGRQTDCANRGGAEPMMTQTVNIDPRPANWRRVTRHPALMEYRRLAFLVAVVNLSVFVIGLRDGWWTADGGFALGPIADMALINLSLGILIRQQRVVNALFWLATSYPYQLAFVDTLGRWQSFSFWRSALGRHGCRYGLVRIPSVCDGVKPQHRRCIPI